MRRSGSNRRGVGRNELMIGGGVVAVLVIIVAALSMGNNHDQLRTEVAANVDAIRAAQLEHKKLFGDYVSATPAPRAPLDANQTGVAWEPSEGFRKLSWAPSNTEQVHAVYSVNVTSDGFTVTGIADLDGDGVLARFQATEAEAAKQLTEASVY